MSDSLNLLYTEVEDEVRASVRQLLTARCESAAVQRIYDGDRSLVAPLWRALSQELGLAALLVPEEHGGAGATAREAAVVLEELGHAVAPVPFLTSAVIATRALVGTDDRLLSQLATGEVTAALLVPFSTHPGALTPVITERAGALTGQVTSVAGALEADVLLVPVADAGGGALYAVPAEAASLTPVISLDMTRQLADVRLDGAVARLVRSDAASALQEALWAGAALLASEQYGVAKWSLETTVAYLSERRQFGRILGSYQALKHRLADLYTAVESGGAAARYAAAALAAGDEDLPVAAAVAQSYLSDTAVLAGEEAVQLHGGMGMTWEHPAHLYLKKAKADQIALGTPGIHRAHLARLIDLPALS